MGLVIAATDLRLRLWSATEMPRHTTGSSVQPLAALVLLQSLADTGFLLSDEEIRRDRKRMSRPGAGHRRSLVTRHVLFRWKLSVVYGTFG